MSQDAIFERTRAYQQEMFERSMEGNRIIVMDTGTGKTQVAMLRMRAELDRCAADKRIWFLTPSVDLCIQQHTALQQALPAFKMRLLLGEDNVDKWSEQKVWDAALDQVRVVVSTHAILQDALRHGFVSLRSLALLVFDEAHHCMKKHPANIIMKDFYHEAKAKGDSIPHILGLSASLINSSRLGSVSTIEANMDSVSVTPRLQREDLSHHVSAPECRILHYRTDAPQSDGVLALAAAQEHAKTEKEQRTLKKFYDKAQHVCTELGPSAADFFIRQTITFLRTRSDGEFNLPDETADALLALLETHVAPACQSRSIAVSHKVQCLMDFLLERDDLCGIVFVEQRVVASVLSAMLNELAPGRIRSATSVGRSANSARKYTITELLDRNAQKQALPSFRDGRTNLIIGTSTLEEGIDVQACNVVACFDMPGNVKGFIQRRGRARQRQSVYALLIEKGIDGSKVAQWSRLEMELIALCQEDREPADYEETEEDVEFTLRVDSTGAQLSVDAALSHLHHFCQVVEPRSKPQFVYHREKSFVKATVTLPSSVPVLVRQVSSTRMWLSETAAKKDAAFHAYKQLYEAGLLNDHLLPIVPEPEDIPDAPPPLIQDEIPNWWAESGEPSKLEIEIESSNMKESYILHASRPVSLPPTLKLYWNQPYRIRFQHHSESSRESTQDLHEVTNALYQAPRSNRHPREDNQLLTLLQPLEISEQYKLPELVRIKSLNDAIFVVHDRTKLDVKCSRLRKRRNFLIPTVSQPRPRTMSFDSNDCGPGVSMSYARMGLFMPDILQHIQDCTLTNELLTRLGLEIKHQHVLTAITAPSAQRLYDYQRLEFIGDTVLKYMVSCYLFTSHTIWPEGFLSRGRSFLTCNASLAGAALEKGLAKYIISQSVDYRNWRLPSTATPQLSINLPSKLMADVVEALIGAAWLDGGIENARECIEFFLSPMPRGPAPSPVDDGDFKQIGLLGYTFNNTSLLKQATTHPSYANVAQCDSYERLEFLGDAVLDMLIMEQLAKHINKLSQGRMTQIKAAAVNADLLGYLCFNLSTAELHRSITRDGTETQEPFERSLAAYLHFHPTRRTTYKESYERYKQVQKKVQYELEHGTRHPWQLLKQCGVDKMFSDVIESILGAIFLDSGQQLTPCRDFIRRLGLERYVNRIIDEAVDVRNSDDMELVDQDEHCDEGAADEEDL